MCVISFICGFFSFFFVFFWTFCRRLSSMVSCFTSIDRWAFKFSSKCLDMLRFAYKSHKWNFIVCSIDQLGTENYKWSRRRWFNANAMQIDFCHAQNRYLSSCHIFVVFFLASFFGFFFCFTRRLNNRICLFLNISRLDKKIHRKYWQFTVVESTRGKEVKLLAHLHRLISFHFANSWYSKD